MSFAKKYGKITVAEALELNKVAEWYCGHELVTDCEVKNETYNAQV